MLQVFDSFEAAEAADLEQWRTALSFSSCEPISFLALDDLIESKLAAARDQDLLDAKKLRAIAKVSHAKT